MNLVPTNQLVFVKSTPAAARRLLASLWESELTDRERTIVAALASDAAMDEVWKRLPRKDENAEIVIEKAFDAARLAFAKRPRPPMSKNDEGRNEWIARYTRPTLRDVAGLVLWMREALEGTAKQAEAQWPANSPLSLFAKFVESVEGIERTYGQMADEQDHYLASHRYPRLRNTHSKRTPDIAFSQMMYTFFEREFGGPFHDIVTALTNVIFETDASAETVNKRYQRR